jgi:Peptidase family M28/PA domain
MRSITNNHLSLLIRLIVAFLILSIPLTSQSINPETKAGNERLMEAMHTISSHQLFQYVKELCSENFGGRLTGTEGYNKSAQWLADMLKQWGVQPAGDNGTYFQDFSHPYTLVKESGSLILHIPQKKKSFIDKHYAYETEYVPGSTSGTGKVKAEVIYVGYGITAPELGYDEYKGLNVKGKIVLMEREVPIIADKEPEEFKKWRPYSFHQYKVQNAKDHGAAGMLYIYHIANPNCTYFKDLQLTHISETVVKDLFMGTGRSHHDVLETIKKTRKPQSFKTKKVVTMSNVTEHHPEGISRNVIGKIEGSDPKLKHEAIMLSAHLDHLGYNHKLMPGANDNASGVAVLMGMAKAMHESILKPKRTIIFNFFGAEEQGVAGSKYYLEHPVIPNDKLVGLLNLDGVGRGKMIVAIAGQNYPELMNYIDDANNNYIHRVIRGTKFHNLARPRLDAARFMWAGVPTLSFSTRGGKALPYDYYHKTLDNLDVITPEIMEDLAQLLFIATMELARY